MEELRGFTIGLRVLSYYGLWDPPSGGVTTKILYHFNRHITSLALSVLLVCQILDIFDSWDSFRDICFNMCFTGVVAVCIMKIVTMRVKMNEMKEIIRDRLKYYRWKEAQGCPDLHLLTELSRKLTHFIAATFCVSMFVTDGFMIYPLILKEGPRKFPVPISVPDILRETPYYEITFASILYLSQYDVPIFIAMEFTVLSFMCQIIVQFQILIRTVRRSSFMSRDCVGQEDRHVYGSVSPFLKLIVEEHSVIIRQIQLLNDVHSVNTLLELSFSICLFCALSYDLLLMSDEFTFKMLIEIMYGMLAVGDLVLHAFLITKIQTCSLDLARALYDLNWHLFTPDDRRTITTIIANAQRQPTLAIGGSYVPDNGIIVKVFHNSFNLLALLKKLEYKEQRVLP